ncbi:HesA/MoeB/ThiF family protein [Desulfohalovibrio reitneri]|uniref:HesA/MoeB/ThiF family protein n=1 Tax=Desulfohalovibrio reitneri TaxID=1307759 RepID=UPI00068B9F48|nr:ThiF family adenylyltransferase [Desulfohalovibrio reitneri]
MPGDRSSEWPSQRPEEWSGEWRDELRALARPASLREGDRLVVSGEELDGWAAERNLDRRRAEEAALEAGVVPVARLRNFETLDCAGQLALVRSTCAMAGLGGLGGVVLELLVRAGVGRIRAADGDVFAEHNENRQLLATTANRNRAKSGAALERAAQLGSCTHLETIGSFLEEAGMNDLVRGADLAMDCLGGLAHRRALASACARQGVRLVSAGVAGWTGWLAVVEPGGPSPAEMLGDGRSVEESLGTPGPIVWTLASLQAAESVRLLSGGTSSLSGAMLLVDLEAMRFERVDLV